MLENTTAIYASIDRVAGVNRFCAGESWPGKDAAVDVTTRMPGSEDLDLEDLCL